MARGKKKEEPPEEPDANLVVRSGQDALALYWDTESLGTDGVFESILSMTAPKTPLPRGPKAIFLSRLILKPDLYKSFLALVLSGASIKAAGGAVGIPPGHTDYWLNVGGSHYVNGKDTWYSRFYYDVFRAKNQARASAQARVKTIRAKDWLNNDADNKGWSSGEVASPQLENVLEAAETETVLEGEMVTSDMVQETFRQLHQMGALPSPETLVREAMSQEGMEHAPEA